MALVENFDPRPSEEVLFGDRPWYQDPDPTSFPVTYDNGRGVYENPSDLAKRLYEVGVENRIFQPVIPLLELYAGVEGNKITPFRDPRWLTGLRDERSFHTSLGLGVHDAMRVRWNVSRAEDLAFFMSVLIGETPNDELVFNSIRSSSSQLTKEKVVAATQSVQSTDPANKFSVFFEDDPEHAGQRRINPHMQEIMRTYALWDLALPNDGAFSYLRIRGALVKATDHFVTHSDPRDQSENNSSSNYHRLPSWLTIEDYSNIHPDQDLTVMNGRVKIYPNWQYRF